MKNADIYNKLRAYNEEDILLHFPKSYDDMALSDLSVPLRDLQKVVLFGSPYKLVSLQGGRIIRLFVTSQEGKNTPIMIFGQPFYSRVLKAAQAYYFIGTYKAKQKMIMVYSVIREDAPLVNNRYKPNYVLPHDISQASFYNLVLDILDNRNEYINEKLPLRLREKYALESRLQAFRDVHVPIDLKTVQRGLRVFKYEEALNYCLVGLYQKARQSAVKKKKMAPIDKKAINSFILSLPYKLTSDQVSCIREIVLDMDRETCMNRLLQGDVGTGKTIVAFLAMYANALRGGQAALMAPTLALAEQHYKKALEVFAATPFKPVLIDASMKKSDVESAFSDIGNGNISFVIGTQSLFNKGLVYNNLTLAIIDEQHKFGVEQREKFAAKGEGVDLLMMSATPIPRTLSMIVNTDLDVSFLHEFPSKKREVETRVVTSIDPLIKKAVSRALQVHRQVFVIAPKIEKGEGKGKLSSKALYESYCEEYGEDKVSFLTGRVSKEGQNEAYEDFQSGRKPILVSTSVVEVGIDVATAGLLIVYESNYFGLASLHQLRGRIGRDGEGALALLVYDGDDQEARQKLDYLAKHTDGEEVALYDLEHRGGGEIDTNKQSGESHLMAANFVTDYKVFACAKSDALEMLKAKDDKEYCSYVNQVLDKSQQR